MTRSEKIGLGYRIFLGVFTFALGVLLVVGACELFFSEGGFPYEEVQARLKMLLAPFLLWAIASSAAPAALPKWDGSQRYAIPIPAASRQNAAQNARIPQSSRSPFLRRTRRRAFSPSAFAGRREMRRR